MKEKGRTEWYGSLNKLKKACWKTRHRFFRNIFSPESYNWSHRQKPQPPVSQFYHLTNQAVVISTCVQHNMHSTRSNWMYLKAKHAVIFCVFFFCHPPKKRHIWFHKIISLFKKKQQLWTKIISIVDSTSWAFYVKFRKIHATVQCWSVT